MGAPQRLSAHPEFRGSTLLKLRAWPGVEHALNNDEAILEQRRYTPSMVTLDARDAGLSPR